MPTFTPTEADRQTGARLRDLRKRRGETMQQTIDRSGIKIKQSAFSKTELGDRRLTEIEATVLAAHFGTTVDKIIVKPTSQPVGFIKPAETEQAWLGNDEAKKPALFSLPTIGFGGVDLNADVVTIERNAPMTPEQYRLDVWLPYLEARYAADQQKTA